MPKMICSKLINKYHNNFFASYFRVEKIQKLISWKYYWLSLRKNIETYIKGYNICLALKMVRYKPYNKL